MSDNHNTKHLVWNDPSEMMMAEWREKEILSKQPENKRGCPFCGHLDMQTIVRPVLNGETLYPEIPTRPHQLLNYSVDLLVCQNCRFVMPFLAQYVTAGEG